LRLVELADLRATLPDDTPSVSAETREAQARARRRGVQLRRRW